MMHATTAVATSNIHQIHLAAKPSQKSPRPPSRAPSLPSPSQYAQFADQIHYSARYSDDVYEYRHVIVPKNMLRAMPKWYFRSPHHAPNGVLRLLTEDEWRSVGITQSLGWEHYDIHEPEPHILLFRREKDFQIRYPHGKPAPEAELEKAPPFRHLDDNDDDDADEGSSIADEEYNSQDDSMSEEAPSPQEEDPTMEEKYEQYVREQYLLRNQPHGIVDARVNAQPPPQPDADQDLYDSDESEPLEADHQDYLRCQHTSHYPPNPQDKEKDPHVRM